MDSEIPVFSSEAFGNVHAFEENGMVYFCGAEVAEILGYENSFEALDSCPQLLGGDDVSVLDCYIPEHSVCHLVHNSKSLNARMFELWLFNCVIPRVRADTVRYNIKEGTR